MRVFDPVRILDVLARHDVEFVVIGGFAAELYRAPIPRTQDVDVTPRLSEANLGRLSAALYELQARVRTVDVAEGLPFSHDASSLARVGVWNLTTAAGDFDLSFRHTGTEGYDDLVATPLSSKSPATRLPWRHWPTSCGPRQRRGAPRTWPPWPRCDSGSTPERVRPSMTFAPVCSRC